MAESRLTTVERLKSFLGLRGLDGSRELSEEKLEIWMDGDSGAIAASVEVLKDRLILDVDFSGVTTTTPRSGVFFFADYPTLEALASAIELVEDWIVLLYVDPSDIPACLSYAPEASCLGYGNRLALSGDADYRLGEILDQTSGFVSTWCHRIFTYGTHSETLSGDDESELFLQNFPVVSVDSVEIDEVAETEYEILSDVGILYLEGGWAEGTGNIEVTYRGGYTSIPEDLQDLVCEIAAIAYHKSGRDPKVLREKIGSYQVSFFEGFLNADTWERLHLWARWES